MLNERQAVAGYVNVVCIPGITASVSDLAKPRAPITRNSAGMDSLDRSTLGIRKSLATNDECGAIQFLPHLSGETRNPNSVARCGTHTTGLALSVPFNNPAQDPVDFLFYDEIRAKERLDQTTSSQAQSERSPGDGRSLRASCSYLPAGRTNGRLLSRTSQTSANTVAPRSSEEWHHRSHEHDQRDHARKRTRTSNGSASKRDRGRRHSAAPCACCRCFVSASIRDRYPAF